MNEAVPFSPIALMGTIALFAAYIVGAWGVASGIAGNARHSRRLVGSSVYALYGFSALIGLASALMIYAFVTHDFSIKYVAHTSNVAMSMTYKVTAFWGGLDGSLLFWVLVLGLFSVVAIAVNSKRHRDMIGYVVATILIVQLFFLSLLIFTKNPFATSLTAAPNDGEGLNPLLQNYWMVIHPPSLYTGFVAATIPFAFGIGALASGRLDDLWLGSVRTWMLICFGFLSLGLILGGRWAYEELGWGGYWAWDPVENAGLIPWFTATAFLHSAIIQEQRGMMKRWNLGLVCFTFFWTIFGTFMTRSGIVQSVHAFGEDNVLALQFVVFMAVIAIVSVGLIAYRWNKLGSKSEFDSFYSREFAFLVNNWILLACAFFVVFATMFPTISESLDGSRVSVGIDFFNRWMTPLGLILLFLAGAAPLLAWRRTTRERLLQQFAFPLGLTAVTIVVLLIFFPQTKHMSAIFSMSIRAPISLINFGIVAFTMGSIGQEYFRGTRVRMKQTGGDPVSSVIGLVLSKRRKYGGYIIHLGVAIMFIGFAGKAYERVIDRTIKVPTSAAAANYKWNGDNTIAELPGASESVFAFGDYKFVYERLIHTSDDAKDAITSQVSIWSGNERINVVYPAKWDYHRGEEPTTEVAITVRPTEDVYVVLTGYDMESELANFRVFINPLILWVWVGTIILLLGTLVCLIPQSLVDRINAAPRPTARVGRAADLGILALLVGGVLAAGTMTAHAQAEHPPAGGGMGDSGIGWAAMNRPDSATSERAMKELICQCGCPRESIFDCKCQPAAKSRATVLEFLKQVDPATGKPVFDLSTESGRTTAYNAVLDDFVVYYGGEQVLATPRSKFSWLFPVLAGAGGLVLIIGLGRRWIAKGKLTAAAQRAAVASPEGKRLAEDEKYADKLDDELARSGGLMPGRDDDDDEVVASDAAPLPTAVAATSTPVAVDNDPQRWVRRGIFLGVLLVGWLFIGWQNRFYLTAPTIVVGLGYLAVLSAIYAMWRTSVVAVADEAEDDGADSTWGAPAGRRGELEREKRTLLKAIKEAEFDREMGKLSLKDAEEMIAVYRLRAIESIKELDHLESGGSSSIRDQIEREVKARLELDAKASKAKAEAKADAARDKKRKGKAAGKSDEKPDDTRSAAEKRADAKTDAKEQDSHEPPSENDSTTSAGEVNSKEAAANEADARDADMHEPPSEHDSTVAANESNLKVAT